MFSFCKWKASESFPFVEHAKRPPLWRERGTDARRWKVESNLLEQRKTYGCDKSPLFIRILHRPTQISILVSRTCLFIGKHADGFLLPSDRKPNRLPV